MFNLHNKKLAYILSLVLLTVLIVPVLSFAATGLVPCDGVIDECKFDDFVEMINGIINWIISIAGVIFTISAIYGGYLYMTSGENPGNKAKAKSMLWSTLIGFVIILAAWVIVYTIVHYLASSSEKSSILKFLK